MSTRATPEASPSRRRNETAGFARAAVALAWSRIRRSHLRSMLGAAWVVITPAAIFLIYWLVFGAVLGLEWTDPESGRSLGYLAPFALGYALYLFVADVVGGSPRALIDASGLIRRGGAKVGLVMASFAAEYLIKLGVYLAIALALALPVIGAPSLGGTVVFLGFSALFVAQALAIGVLLMLLTPYFGDLQEVARLATRLFIYAAGISFPLALIPETYRQVALALPLIGPLNQARDALMFGSEPTVVFSAGALTATAALAGAAALAYRLLHRKVVDLL